MVTSKDSPNPIFLSENPYFTSYVRKMFWATILYKFHVFNSHDAVQYVQLCVGVCVPDVPLELQRVLALHQRMSEKKMANLDLV